ncbi:E3 ubiquitin-protein ligase ATL41-like [Triticum dicoccoides]|uniref:E3 ubiquitin-protein ligase ATL41-like n=1 Tax=Triticum dicoccoides TaxID=85692 RepID=UPI001890D598|nr:E3 ubiquitin-protein ligase ATL41-like [Triticum dicoccoides]
MSSPAASPGTSDDAADAPGITSSNLTLLYIIIAVVVGVVLYLAVRYGRSLLSEWRELNGAGHGPPPAFHLGLSSEDIAALPTFTYRARATPTPSPQGSWGGCTSGGGKRRSGSKGRATPVECVVCLQELEDGDVVRVLPACRHFFHGSCIDTWLRAHSSCPVCRAEPESARPGETALSPPLPQLRRCGASPERPTASRILADILARSPLRIGGSTSESKERIISRSPSPAPTARDYTMSRSPSRTPLTHGMVDERERGSLSQSPQTLEVVVVRSKSPSPMRFGRQSTTTCLGVLERTDASMSASPSPPATYAEDAGESSSKLTH